MARRRKNWNAVLCAAMIAGGFTFRTGAASQVPGALQSAAAGEPKQESAAQAPPSTPQPSSSTADPGKQIDELMKLSDREMNVTGQFQRSAEYAQQALDLSEKVGDKRRAANAIVYLGAAYSYQGKSAEAIEISQKGIALARESGDKKVLEQALNTAAGVIGGAGRLEEALALFFEVRDIARAIGDRVMEYMSLLNIGEAYTRSGEPDRADAPLQEALRLAGELKHGGPNGLDYRKKGTEMALLNLGAMELDRSRFPEALSYYERVHVSRPQSPLWQITALEGMAAAHEQLGQPQKSIELLQEAIPRAEKNASGVQAARLWSELGESQEAVGQLQAALASQNRSLSITHANGPDPDFEWQVDGRIGHVLRALKQDSSALDYYQKAITGIEGLRSVAINTEEGRAGVLARSRAVYAETADLLVDMHREADGFKVAEQGRARAFLEMLAATRGGLPDDLTPDQAKRESALLVRISSLQKELWKEGISEKEKLQQKAALTAAEEDMDAFHVEVRRLNPLYASIRYPEPIDVSGVQSELLDDKSMMLEFLLGKKRSLVWVVSKDKLAVGALPPLREIEDRVLQYRSALTDKTSALTMQASMNRIERLGKTLYTMLLGPVQSAIPRDETLIVIPDGVLAYLPMEALVTRVRQDRSGATQPVYLVQSHNITYAPSASALATVRAMNAHKSDWDRALLAFGDPIVGTALVASNGVPQQRMDGPMRTDAQERSDAAGTPATYSAYTERGFSLARLPFTREEVLGISKLFPPSQSAVYLGRSATEETIKREKLDRYRYIHLASHGFIDETVPERSGILFSRNAASYEDGVLQAGEIMRLKLDADLVTLSACSTGLGKLVNGEGMLSLTRSFFYAGARNVTVSLWNVNDSATSTLMKGFYEQLNKGTSKSEALRQAKLRLLSSSNTSWRHPYFWAAFVLVGDGD